MKKPVRKTYHHGSLRAVLISEAESLLIKLGGPHFTMRDLAARIGVSHSAAYKHFSDKGALLSAIAVDGFKALERCQNEARATSGTVMERLQKMGIAYIHFAIKNESKFRVMFGPELSDKKKYPEVAVAGRAAFQPVVEQVDLCRKAGLTRQAGAAEMALVLWSTVHGLSCLLIDRQTDSVIHSKSDSERIITLLTETIVSGLGAK